jgi:hypothetical protein
LVRGFLVLQADSGLDRVARFDQRAARVTGCVGALPESARDVLPTGFYVRDGAAAVINQGSEPSLAVPGGATVGR